MNALVATALLGSISLADEIDDKIQKLEKENKLLELQKKKRELENQIQTTNNNDISNGSSSTLGNKTKMIKNPNSKNGGFIGVEGVLGGADISILVDSSILVSKSNTTFDLGLMGGYQHYFGKSQRHGIKASAHLYSGFGSDWTLSFDYKTDVSTMTKTGNVSYVPVKFGFDVKYLYDFFERGKHTLGLNVGLGYEFDSYVNGKAEADGFKQDFDNIFLNSFYPVVGLHYYYGHHQFELMYRFGGILDEQTRKVVLDDIDLTQTIILNTQSYLTINYAYRF